MTTDIQTEPFLIVQVPVDVADRWPDMLAEAARRCYVSDATLDDRAARSGRPRVEILQSRIPDPGPVMSGDFGEILTAMFLAASEYPREMLDPKKWRLKQDRLAPAPKSDVVQFHVPDWPEASDNDRIVCAEVKSKATSGERRIAEAIEHSGKDRDGRLIKTLAWLRERALSDGLANVDEGTIGLEHIERFINATDYGPAAHEFKAVLVICASLLGEELEEQVELQDDCTLILISVPNLKVRYEAVFNAMISVLQCQAGPV
jgi:hypothetical protein